MKNEIKRKIISILVVTTVLGSISYLMATAKKRQYKQANMNKSPVILSKSRLYVDFDRDGAYQPFFIKGVCYNPMPIGRYPFDSGYKVRIDERPNNIFNDEEILRRDFDLLKKMNCNTIRIWKANKIYKLGKRRRKRKNRYYPNFLTKKTLDLAEEYGLKVIPGFWINTLEPKCKNWEKIFNHPDFTDEEIREDLLEEFKGFVTQFKNHPAILFWAIGNENNYHFDHSNFEEIKSFYSLINEMAKAAHDIEGPKMYHPVTFINGDIHEIGDLSYGTTDQQIPHLDAWGINAYRGESFGDLFKEYAKKTKKAIWISEFGVDVFHAFNPKYTEVGKPEEKIQAEWLSSLWNDLIDNRNSVLGGCVMEYSDEWWKPDGTFKDGKYNFTHEPFGLGPQDRDCDGLLDWTPPAPDKFFHLEWFGIMKIKNFGEARDEMWPREAYYTLKDHFLCDPLHKPFFAGERNNKSCDDSYACCADPSGKSEAWKCVTECSP
ncbi:MAG: hypothetical protein KAR05_04630 [Candidatus Omnitrophica bacterium]|nr:hypothetical protein [Candidatus Omnitrophota bacterium]